VDGPAAPHAGHLPSAWGSWLILSFLQHYNALLASFPCPPLKSGWVVGPRRDTLAEVHCQHWLLLSLQCPHTLALEASSLHAFPVEGPPWVDGQEEKEGTVILLAGQWPSEVQMSII
jgi:hypothetical protein